MDLIFQKSKPGRKGASLPELDIPKKEILPKELLRQEINLPEVSEVDIVRHYTALSRRNHGVDNGFYPLGSCTMKYNPKINEDMARLPGLTNAHPYQNAQGCLQLMYELERALSEITGMDKFTLQPAAGAHGELTGLMLVKAYFRNKGEKRTKIITPDSSHGTNPASSTMCGFETLILKSNAQGQVDIEDLKRELTQDVAAVMLTIPNTLGIFEEKILEITKLVHDNGSLVYMDGANMNAMLGIANPGAMGVDILHLNLHKTFSTPHGCGGPGSGPVGVKKELIPFLPQPSIEKTNERYELNHKNKLSIGRVKAFYGNFNVMVKAYTYIKALGANGLKDAGTASVINANYMKEKLKKHFKLPYDQICKHEFVLSDENMPNEVTTNDIAKRLLDFGFHAPTVYFPLIVHGAIMIEPTETESKETMDSFIDAMLKIKQEAEKNPEIVKTAPHTLPVKRLDAVKAARQPDLKWEN